MVGRGELISPNPSVAASQLSSRERRSRAPEFYGFVAWTSTSLLFVMYLLWALLADEQLHYLGVTWYPNREWAVLLPAYSITLVLLTYFVYFSLALARTPVFSDIRTFVDTKAHFPATDAANPYPRYSDPDAIPEPYDIPIGVVNRVLYGPK